MNKKWKKNETKKCTKCKMDKDNKKVNHWKIFKNPCIPSGQKL